MQWNWYLSFVLIAVALSWYLVSLADAGEFPILKDLYADDFLIGFAARSDYWLDEPLLGHFNAVTAENMMRWESLQPDSGIFCFRESDALIKYAETTGMQVIGHTLVWHQQTPAWVFLDDNGDDVAREVLLARMEEHIKTVVGHFKGKVKGWDVVNEVIDQDPSTGQWALRDSKWRQIIGDDYVEYAFRFAHEADPDAELRLWLG